MPGGFPNKFRGTLPDREIQKILAKARRNHYRFIKRLMRGLRSLFNFVSK